MASWITEALSHLRTDLAAAQAERTAAQIAADEATHKLNKARGREEQLTALVTKFTNYADRRPEGGAS